MDAAIIVTKGEPKEIAALVVAIQERAEIDGATKMLEADREFQENLKSVTPLMETD